MPDNELTLRYGCNPHQVPARVFMKDKSPLPIQALNSSPGYINLLDALNSWRPGGIPRGAEGAAGGRGESRNAAQAGGEGLCRHRALRRGDLRLPRKCEVIYSRERG